MQNSGKSVFDLEPNVAAGLAYIPVCLCHLIVSIGVLATDKTNKLPRFHAFQSLLLSASIIVAYIITVALVMIILLISAAAGVPEINLLSFLIYIVFLLVALAAFIGMVISCIKAFQGQIFRLPIIGSLADKWSN